LNFRKNGQDATVCIVSSSSNRVRRPAQHI